MLSSAGIIDIDPKDCLYFSYFKNHLKNIFITTKIDVARLGSLAVFQFHISSLTKVYKVYRRLFPGQKSPVIGQKRVITPLLH